MAAKLKTSGDFEGTANAGKQEWGGKGDYSWIGFTNSENVGGDMKTSLAVSISTYLLGKISNYLAAWRIDTFLGARYNVVAGPKAYKYEYYYEPPTKVLLHGEKKADLKKHTKVGNEAKRALLGFTDVAEKHERLLKEEETNAATQKQTILNQKLTALTIKTSAQDVTYEGTTLTFKTPGGTSELMVSPIRVRMKSAAASITVAPASITHRGPIIKLG